MWSKTKIQFKLPCAAGLKLTRAWAVKENPKITQPRNWKELLTPFAFIIQRLSSTSCVISRLFLLFFNSHRADLIVAFTLRFIWYFVCFTIYHTHLWPLDLYFLSVIEMEFDTIIMFILVTLTRTLNSIWKFFDTKPPKRLQNNYVCQHVFRLCVQFFCSLNYNIINLRCPIIYINH